MTWKKPSKTQRLLFTHSKDPVVALLGVKGPWCVWVALILSLQQASAPLRMELIFRERAREYLVRRPQASSCMLWWQQPMPPAVYSLLQVGQDRGYPGIWGPGMAEIVAPSRSGSHVQFSYNIV